jgi:hypothetical protein
MSFFYPELSKMSASGSTSADRKSKLPVIETGILIKTNNITKLIVVDNYQTCEIQGEYLLISINAEKIGLENI